MTGTGANRTRRTPPNTEIPSVSWLTSRRAWLLTAGLYAVVAAAVGAYAAVRNGAPPVDTAVRAATQPVPALATFLAARAIALYVVQRRRDAAVAAGHVTVTDDASQGALVTVASFSILGLVSLTVAVPVLYTTSLVEFRVLAAAVAVLTVPASYLLLAYQLGELAAADRYRRRYAVQPAVWQFLWTAPLVVLAWTLLTGHALTSPAWLDPSGTPDPLSAWTILLAAAAAPTAVALAYTLRRQTERFVRGILP